MSLLRQLWLLLLGTVVVGVLGSALITLDTARCYVETQLRLKNSDNAQALALTLSQQRGDLSLAEVTISAQFDTGFYERIVLAAQDGRVLVERRAEPRSPDAPSWFARTLPIASVPGIAQVSDGWRPIGTLQLVSDSGFAHADLWRGSLRSAGWLMLLGLVAGALAALVLSRIHTPLQATVEQARALVERRFVTVPEPRLPELRELGRAMNSMVHRLQSVFSEQGMQLEALRRHAQTDALTGLAHRAHFLALLSSLLARRDAPPDGTLLLLRLRDLATLNRELGHARTDALLRALADALRSVCARRDVAHAGRLNGCDFALLQAGAEPAASAQELLALVQDALAMWPGASVAIGAVAWQPGTAVALLMQRADAALVRAEMHDGYSLAVEPAGRAAPALGETAWRSRLIAALQRGDTELGAYPVLDRSGRLLHLECPLRLRLEPSGPLEAAASWLPWAQRGQLTAQADLTAVGLALARIADDAQPRGVNLAPDSLLDSEFAARLRVLVQSRPKQATALWLEVGERAAVERLGLVRELAQQLRPLGVRLGLEHAGERLARIDHLYEAGLDYVKLDASLSLGMAQDARRIDFVRGLVGMLHGLGMQAHAEGVSAAADAQVLWDCGVDAQTGPWVSAGAAGVLSY